MACRAIADADLPVDYDARDVNMFKEILKKRVPSFMKMVGDSPV